MLSMPVVATDPVMCWPGNLPRRFAGEERVNTDQILDGGLCQQDVAQASKPGPPPVTC